MPSTAVRLVVEGRVQGVGFRLWTVHEARRRGLRGWVRNRRDGSVEALIIGEPEKVAAMIEACRHGPRLARVDRLAQIGTSDDGSVDFEERPTT